MIQQDNAAQAASEWKMVPIEPTPEMQGVLQWFDRGSPAEIAAGWRKVLAAAPPAPAPAAGEVVAWEGPTGQLMPHFIFEAWRQARPGEGHEHFVPLVRATPASAPPAAEPLNLNDPAVQKRLAAQWGYVPAAEPVAAAAGVVEALRSALERVTTNYRLTLSGKPVRDVTETLAECDAALAAASAQTEGGT